MHIQPTQKTGDHLSMYRISGTALPRLIGRGTNFPNLWVRHLACLSIRSLACALQPCIACSTIAICERPSPYGTCHARKVRQAGFDAKCMDTKPSLRGTAAHIGVNVIKWKACEQFLRKCRACQFDEHQKLRELASRRQSSL